MTSNFHRNRIIALFIGFIAIIIWWYCLVLMTNPENDFSVNKTQILGLLFAIIIGILSWTKKCLIIRPIK